MSTEAQKRASAKYDADNTVRITLKLNKKTDADIIQKLESEPNKSAYIKAKLREQISTPLLGCYYCVC